LEIGFFFFFSSFFFLFLLLADVFWMLAGAPDRLKIDFSSSETIYFALGLHLFRLV